VLSGIDADNPHKAEAETEIVIDEHQIEKTRYCASGILVENEL
jgi:hypothetical protein